MSSKSISISCRLVCLQAINAQDELIDQQDKVYQIQTRLDQLQMEMVEKQAELDRVKAEIAQKQTEVELGQQQIADLDGELADVRSIICCLLVSNPRFRRGKKLINFHVIIELFFCILSVVEE